MNRLTLVVCAIFLAGAATLSAQMRELGHWRGGHFFGPGDDRFRDRWEYRNDLRRDRRDLHEHRRRMLRERYGLREEFRRDMRDRGRQFRFRDRGGHWN